MPIGKNAAEAISSGRKPPAAQNFMGTRGLKKMKRTPPTKGAGGRAGSLRGPRAAAAGHLPHARTPPPPRSVGGIKAAEVVVVVCGARSSRGPIVNGGWALPRPWPRPGWADR
jgi:hypothetical protein